MRKYNEKIRLKEQGEEDLYFSKRDHELIKAMRKKELAKALAAKSKEEKKAARYIEQDYQKATRSYRNKPGKLLKAYRNILNKLLILFHIHIDEKDDENEPLESFKIADARPRAAISGGANPDEADEEALTLGFQRIETLLDNEPQETVQARLEELASKLRALIDGANTNREKAQAKKALAAVERASDLMEHLYQTKAELEAGLSEP